MKYLLIGSFLLLPTLLFSQVEEFNWLIGTWQEENKKSFEMWEKKNEFLSGAGFKLDDQGNKIVSEEIKLIKRGKDFYYVPDVAGPQGPIEFKITSFDKNSFTAENPSHDFPKKIIYKRMDDLHLQAWIGRDQYLSRFLFTRIK